MTSKQETIASTYCDRSGFQSRNDTLTLDAKKKSPSITMDDVKSFFAKNVEQ